MIDILLGFFAGKKWDGEYESNGAIILKKTGQMLGFHIIDLKTLQGYLFENMKLETPSSSQHKFGKLYLGADNKLYFKLNLQLRWK